MTSYGFVGISISVRQYYGHFGCPIVKWRISYLVVITDIHLLESIVADVELVEENILSST